MVSTRFLPDKKALLQKFKPIAYKSSDSLRRANLLWNILILSLPLDLIIFDLLNRYYSPIRQFKLDPQILITLVAFLIVLIYLNIPKIYLVIKQMQCYMEKIRGSKAHWILIFIMAAFPLIDLFTHSSISSARLAISLAVIIVVLTIVQNNKQSRINKEKDTILKKDKCLWVENANKELFYFSIIPLFFARIFSIIALIHLTFFGFGWIYYLPFFISSILLLVYFKPDCTSFMANCPKCQMLTSVVIKHLGCCPGCNLEHFVVAEKEIADDVSNASDMIQSLNKNSLEKEKLRETFSSIKKIKEFFQPSPPDAERKTLLSKIKFLLRSIKEDNVKVDLFAAPPQP